MSDIIENICESCGGKCCKPCITKHNFDDANILCRIYDDRPEPCIAFPFRNRPYAIVLSNFCPVVREVVGDRCELTTDEIRQNDFLWVCYQQASGTSYRDRIMNQESFIVT